MMGRPSKLSARVRDRVVELVRAGCPIDTAVQAVGIHRDTFYEWMRRGRSAIESQSGGKELAYVEFCEAVDRARAEVEADAVQVIRAAMPRDWRAAAWFLEHSQPQRWGRRRAEIDVVHHAGVLAGHLERGHELRLQAERQLALTPGQAEAIEVPGQESDDG